jgi:hypothetical protein
MPPPLVTHNVRGNALELFFGWFLLFLANFAIFRYLLKIVSVLGIRVLVSMKYLKTLYILYTEW